MKALSTLGYTEQGDVATITLTQPRIDMRMVRDLTIIADHLEDDSGCAFVIFRGANGCFSKGIDFTDFRPDEPMDIHGFGKWEKICSRLERLPMVTIAAMEGPVVGGGVQLALVSDMRIATGTTTLQLPEVHMGFLPGMATFRLAKYVGLGRAKQLIIQGREIDAHKAAAIGLIDDVVYNLDDGIARAIEGFRPVQPVAAALARRLLNESYAAQYEYAIGHFLAAQQRAISQTSFLETVKKAREESGI